MKSKRILALTGAVILITLYVSSIIFALMDSPLAENLLLASLFCTIVIPAVLYGYAVALRYFKRKNNVQKSKRLSISNTIRSRSLLSFFYTDCLRSLLSFFHHPATVTAFSRTSLIAFISAVLVLTSNNFKKLIGLSNGGFCKTATFSIYPFCSI